MIKYNDQKFGIHIWHLGNHALQVKRVNRVLIYANKIKSKVSFLIISRDYICLSIAFFDKDMTQIFEQKNPINKALIYCYDFR